MIIVYVRKKLLVKIVIIFPVNSLEFWVKKFFSYLSPGVFKKILPFAFGIKVKVRFDGQKLYVVIGVLFIFIIFICNIYRADLATCQYKNGFSGSVYGKRATFFCFEVRYHFGIVTA